MSMVTDDDLDWKPDSGTNWMTTGQLMMHLTNACGFCVRGFQTVASVQAAHDALAADKQVALDMIAQAGEDRMNNEKTSAPWEPGNQRTYGEHFFGMVLHLQSHKSQLFYYLKLMGRDVNTMHLWGM